MKTLLLLTIFLVIGCATKGFDLDEEYADLTPPGVPMQSLARAGWSISQPVKLGAPDLPAPEDPSSSDGRSWTSFLSALRDGDELRPVSNNAGIGYAIFRGGKYLDLYLVTIF